MIDPMLYTVFEQHTFSRARGKDFYRAGFEYGGYCQFARKRLDTARQALSYGNKLQKRWKRLYEARAKFLKANERCLGELSQDPRNRSLHKPALLQDRHGRANPEPAPDYLFQKGHG